MLREEVLLFDAHHWTQQEEEFLCGFVLVFALGGNGKIVRGALYDWARLSLHILDIYHFIASYLFRGSQLKAYWSDMRLIVNLLFLICSLCSYTLCFLRLVFVDWRSGVLVRFEMCLLMSLIYLSGRFSNSTLFLRRLVFRDRRSGGISHREQRTG